MGSTILFVIDKAHGMGTHYIVELVVAVLAVFLAIYLLYNEILRHLSRIPNLPGPLGLPVVGSLLSLKGKITAEEFRRWATRYGDVFQVQLGNSTVVVVNTTSAAEALFIRQREATN